MVFGEWRLLCRELQNESNHIVFWKGNMITFWKWPLFLSRAGCPAITSWAFLWYVIVFSNTERYMQTPSRKCTESCLLFARIGKTLPSNININNVTCHIYSSERGSYIIRPSKRQRWDRTCYFLLMTRIARNPSRNIENYKISTFKRCISGRSRVWLGAKIEKPYVRAFMCLSANHSSFGSGNRYPVWKTGNSLSREMLREARYKTFIVNIGLSMTRVLKENDANKLKTEIK